MKKCRLDKPLILGVTGSYATGKSTVSAMLRRLGAAVIDADKIARELVRPGQAAYKEIARIFGKGVLKKNKQIDRQALGQMVFGNERLLKRLDRALHPRIIAAIRENIRTCRSKVVVLDAPLLLEAGLGPIADKLIVVVAAKTKQIQRAREKTRLSAPQICRRIEAQIPLEEKAAMADFIIDNNSTPENTKKQVAQIWRKLWKNWK